MIEYLIKEDFLLINAETIAEHGGHFLHPINLLNASSLDFLLEAVQSVLFGEPLYPELWDKAGLYMYSVINNHIFNDGNKRTGLEAAIIFLRLNGYRLDRNLTHDEIYHFTIRLASGEFTLKEVQEWFRVNIVSVDKE